MSQPRWHLLERALVTLRPVPRHFRWRVSPALLVVSLAAASTALAASSSLVGDGVRGGTAGDQRGGSAASSPYVALQLGSSDSRAEAVNDSGQIVGWGPQAAGCCYDALLWSGGKMI